MNIDDFIEATDRDLEVDTSTRSGPGSLTPPGLSSPVEVSREVLETAGITFWKEIRHICNSDNFHR